jgi:Ulp1 family protease
MKMQESTAIGRVKIRNEDIIRLSAKEYSISGAIVDHLLHLALKKAQKAKKRWANETIIVSYQFYDRLQNLESANPKYSWKNDFHGHGDDPWFYKRIMFPCWLNHNHWILIVWSFGRGYDGLTGRIRTFPRMFAYDSIQQDRTYVCSQIAMFFADHFVTETGVKRIWRNKGRPLRIWGQAPTQRDDYNCGFYLLQTAKRILNEKDPRKSKYHVPRGEYNKEWEDFIMTKRVKLQRMLINELKAKMARHTFK